LTDFLRSRRLEAPEIDPNAVLDPIARRAERELAELRSLLAESVAPEVAKRLGAQIDKTSDKLQAGGALRAYEDLRGVVDELKSVVLPERGSKSSAMAPMDAARARLLNDVLQIARFTDASQRVQAVQEDEAEKPEKNVMPPQAPAIPNEAIPQATPDSPAATGAAPARAPAPQPVPAPPPVMPAPPVVPAPAPLKPPTDPLFQFWEQTDLIGIGPSVNNLARYISHEGLVPPVAIGVFGDWGSGKTFFIRALQSQIALLSSQSRDALTANQTTVFCSHVVQIEFNAWHFVESNLWASLAAHIFERLYAELERRGKDERGNTNIDGLYQQFSAYKQAVAEQERLRKLTKTLEGKRDEALAKKVTAEKTVRERLTALNDVVGENLEKILGERLTPDDRERLAELLRISNLKELDEASAEAVALAKEGQTLLGRARAQLGWWGGWQLGLFVLLIVAAVFGLPRLVPWILGTQAEQLERLATIVGGYAATAIAALGFLSSNGRKLVNGAKKVEQVLADVRTRVENTPRPGLDAANRALESAEAELTIINKQIAEQRDQLAELADELDPNQLGARLQAFLEDRVKSDAYQKHLGLITLVRKDFSSLYNLMQKYWQNRKVPQPEVFAEVRNALEQTVKQEVPFIERIILYIDDLDRCPEDKVVEVLQAVHLMLGLPLFVVVVAVDVRWVGQSIRKQYGRLVGWDEDKGLADSNGSPSASADDYLEKIFQIPYRIHPIDPEVRKLLLGGMLNQPYLSAGDPTLQNPVVIQQALVPKELSLYPQERTSIEELYRVVGSSPRRVRRFLDVYRLMRAGMEEADVQDLIASGHYAVILSLFAMLSGAPVAGPRIIELLRAETQRDPITPEAATFASQNLADWFPKALRDPLPVEENGVILDAMTYIDGLHILKPDLLVTLRRWIPEIARYSFREVRMQRI
jgi:hypothetical protein